MTDVQPKYAETSYTVDPNNPISDEAPPAAGTSEEEAEAIQAFQETAGEAQKAEREQAKEDAEQWAESDKPRPTEAADRARGQERTEAPKPDEGNDPDESDEGQPVNPDTQTTTLPSEVDPQPVAPDPKESDDDDDDEEDVPDGTTSEVLAWVGTDRERAKDALEAEKDGKQRSTLIGHLEQIAAG